MPLSYGIIEILDHFAPVEILVIYENVRPS